MNEAAPKSPVTRRAEPARHDYAIVFGAAVRPDGRPSRTLLKRIDGARAWAERHPDAMVIATGATGRFGAAEAMVITNLLRAGGIGGDRILVEPCGRDTLESVRLCHRLLRARGDAARVICCTSSFSISRAAQCFCACSAIRWFFPTCRAHWEP